MIKQFLQRFAASLILVSFAATAAWGVDWSIYKNVKQAEDMAYLGFLQSESTLPVTAERLGESLIEASGWGYPDSLQWLLEHHAPVRYQSEKGITPLMAVSMGVMASPTQYLIMRKLLDAGADPNARSKNGENALSFFVRQMPDGPLSFQEVEMASLEALLLVTSDLEQFHAGESLLVIASDKDRWDVVLAIAKAGGNPNAVRPESGGKSALFKCPPQYIAPLVEAGANIAAVDDDGNTVLHAAMMSGRDPRAFIRAALAAGAKDRPNRKGRLAVELGNVEINAKWVSKGDKARYAAILAESRAMLRAEAK